MNIEKKQTNAVRRHDYETPDVRRVGSVEEITRGSRTTRQAIVEVLGNGTINAQLSLALPGR